MRSAADSVLHYVVPLVYARRWLSFGILLAFTVWMGFHASRLQPDPGFEKQIPLTHPYMQVFKQYEQAFGGANLISVALLRKPGADGQRRDIYDAEFLDALRRLTDEVFFLPGVDRARVTSLFTPGVRYLEVVEDGFHTGDVVPRDYRPTPEMLAQIRSNVGKAGLIGRLVAEHEDGALIVAELLEHDPSTGAKLDYRALAAQLEALRARYGAEGQTVHIVGFAGQGHEPVGRFLQHFGRHHVLVVVHYHGPVFPDRDIGPTEDELFVRLDFLDGETVVGYRITHELLPLPISCIVNFQRLAELLEGFRRDVEVRPATGFHLHRAGGTDFLDFISG